MKIKRIPNPVLKLREFNSCQSCTRRYELAPAQAGRWPPSGQLACVNYVFLMLGIWHCIFSGFTARHKAPEQNSLPEFFKGSELFYTASSSAPFTCWNFAKTSLCETGLASSASRYGSPHGDQRCCNAVAKVEAMSAQLLQFVLVDLIAEGNRLPGDQCCRFISLLDKIQGKRCSGSWVCLMFARSSTRHWWSYWLQDPAHCRNSCDQYLQHVRSPLIPKETTYIPGRLHNVRVKVPGMSPAQVLCMLVWGDSTGLH